MHTIDNLVYASILTFQYDSLNNNVLYANVAIGITNTIKETAGDYVKVALCVSNPHFWRVLHNLSLIRVVLLFYVFKETSPMK